MRLLVVFILLMMLMVSGCADMQADNDMSIENNANDQVINVVTTIYPLADIVKELGGERVNVSYLLPAGASPHTYEPTVEQAREVERAHLFVHIGAGLDDWAADLARAAEPGPELLDLSEEVNLIEAPGYRSVNSDDHEDYHDGDHDHGPDDPHYWLDPIIIRNDVCPVISGHFVSIDQEGRDYYDKKLNSYQDELTALHDEIEAAVSGFSHQGFISFHSAWQYFAQRYGLEEVAVVAQFPGQEPSAGWLAELVGIIRAENIGAILTEPQFPSDLAERIAEESGVDVVIIDPLGGEDVKGRESYLKMMRFNLAAFERTMR
ncbi:MAG: metal ABC transporter substrate-binding protein [Bacillota bacterium]